MTENNAFDEAPVWHPVGTIPVPEKVLHPIVENVTDNGDGTYTAYFGYLNDFDVALTLPVGSYNKFTPSPEDRGQTVTFQPGRVINAFSVVFDGSDLVWTLNGETVTAAWHPRNVWSTDTHMLNKRAYLAAAEANGKIYVFGGTNSHLYSQYNSVEEYDPSNVQWTSKTVMPTARQGASAVYLNNKIYVIGGYKAGVGYLTTVEEYDPNNDTWTPKARIKEARGYAGVATVNGKIYIIGGFNMGTIKNSIEEYDPDQDQWTLKTPMPTKRWSLGAAVINGKIYAIGGDIASTNWASPSAIVQEYDPDTDSWKSMQNISSTRCGFGITVLNQKIYIIGGVGGYNLVTEYDPVTEICQNKANITTARFVLAAATLDGSIYAIGGRYGNYYYDTVESMVP